jgi:ribonuclease P protein component
MLAKKYILSNKKVFSALKFKGTKIKVGPFLLSYFNNQSRDLNNRFGIIISAKAVALANKRNYIKRKIRVLLFDYKDQKLGEQFIDLAVIVLKLPTKNEYYKLVDFLEQKFR